MHLEKLEIAGFKSFAAPAVLHFDKGLSAIVGPNGSGKSNIADALRWALGEQATSQMRASQMTDVIFAGTSLRRALGQASVTLHINNADGLLPDAPPQIVVSRRVSRSGESEYAIGGAPARLKDIHRLFMDSGLGPGGYSIIGQGRVDEVLSARNEERRRIFEEAAGIAKFKASRNQAGQKLERERQNREKLDVIIDELHSQMEPLKDEADAARLWLGLRDRVRILAINLFLQTVDANEINGAALQTQAAALQAALEQDMRHAQAARTAAAAYTDARVKTAAARAAQVAQIDAIKDEIHEKDTQIALNVERISSGEAGYAQIGKDMERIAAAKAAAQAEAAADASQILQAEEQVGVLQAELQQNMQAAHLQHDRQQSDEMRSRELSDAIAAAYAALGDARVSVSAQEAVYARLEGQKENLLTATQQHNEKLEITRETFKNTQDALKIQSTALAETNTLVERISTAHERLLSSLNDHRARAQKAAQDLAGISARHRALVQMNARHEGYYAPVRAVLKKSADDPLFSGVMGAVGDLFSASADFEIAIETALGAAAQNIIVQTERDAKIAIEFLKSTKQGRATFLPISQMRPRKMPRDLSALPGYVGAAVDLARCDAQFLPVAEMLLGDVAVFDTLDSAIAAAKAHQNSLKIVTPGGERLSPGGAIAGGAGSSQSGFLSRPREISALDAQKSELQAVLDAHKAQIADLDKKIAATYQSLENAKNSAAAHEKNAATLQGALAAASAQMQAQQAQTNSLLQEDVQLMEKIRSANAQLQDAQRALQAAEDTLRTAQEAQEAHSAQMTSQMHKSIDETDQMGALRISIAEVQVKIEHMQKSHKKTEAQIAAYTMEEKNLLRERENLRTRLETLREAVAAGREDVANLSAALEAAINAAQAHKLSVDEVSAKIQAEEAIAAEYEKKSNDVQRELVRVKMQIEAIDAENMRLHNSIWDEYALSLGQARAFADEDLQTKNLASMLSQAKSEMGAMHNVNPGAIEAYEKLRNRHDLLFEQRKDILDALDGLNVLIRNLTAQMREKFTECFGQINEHFGQCFVKMFGGGNAGISLADPQNPLNSPIEIFAQPPGKALKNLNLLSGGEKALTAIALLFGILQMRPAPFCVLDEIESALDDANVTRFANFLKTLSADNQFIAITHSKGTMEAAGSLIGITMQEPGISGIVSVRLGDA